MAIYNKNGEQIFSVYGVDGDSLLIAYDVNSIIVFTDSPPTIKIMTYNVYSFKEINSQVTMQCAILSEYEPDIIGWQEYSATSPVPSSILGDYMTRVSQHYNYNAISTKYPISNLMIEDYTNQDQWEIDNWHETRCYMKCYISIGGVSVCWINTHLAVHTASTRYAQIGELFDMAENEDYCIITGDLNHYSNNTSSADWQNMYKQFSDAGYYLANCSDNEHFVWTYSSATTASSLDDTTAFHSPNCPDNIIVSGNIEFLNIYFDDTKLSYLNGDEIDHIPIIAELQIN